MVGLHLERDGDSYLVIEQSETPSGKEISLMDGNLLKPLIYSMMVVPVQYLLNDITLVIERKEYLLCGYTSVYKQKTFGC